LISLPGKSIFIKYAKFELEDPALHFSLNVRPYEKQGILNHLGFQVNGTEEVLALGERLRQSGLLLIDEMNTTCCYAVQDKVWVHEPDGNAWGIFYTKEDSEFEGAGESRNIALCCVPVESSAATAELACCAPVTGPTTIKLEPFKNLSISNMES